MGVFWQTVGLLALSNIFMTFAWYAHLKDLAGKPWFIAALIAWGIAFFEYCFQVPANRFGNRYLSAVELKTMQEVITLLVFVGFSTFYLGEPIKWNHLVGFAFIIAGASAIFYK